MKTFINFFKTDWQMIVIIIGVLMMLAGAALGILHMEGYVNLSSPGDVVCSLSIGGVIVMMAPLLKTE